MAPSMIAKCEPSMTPEQTARRYEDLPGFELLDYAEVALPIWQLNVEAVSAIRRGLQPIKEFALRSLDAGLGAQDLSGFLGLDEAVVRGVLADLVSDRYLAPGENAQITDAGRKALIEGHSSPSNEILSLLFDGILRRPVSWSALDFAYPREVEDGVVAEIPATPAAPPEITDLALPDVDQVLRDNLSGTVDGRDILRLKRIVRHRRLFRRAVALIFRSKKGELRTRFIVNGVPDELLEQGFAEHGGNLRKGLVRAFSDSYLKANLRSHLGHEAGRRILDANDYLRRQAFVSIAVLKVDNQKRRVTLVERGELPPSDRPTVTAIKEAELAEVAAREALASADARPAAVYEKIELLQRGMREAKSSLSFSTRGLSPQVVDKKFLNNLRDLLDKQVHVTLTMHVDAVGWRARGRDWAQAHDTITAWAKARPDLLNLRQTREGRYYHLAWDDRIALVANRPMLSNHGRTRAFEQFAGFVLQESSLIREYLTRVNR